MNEQVIHWSGIGRRKEATARVHIFSSGEGKVLVNNRNIEDYFKLDSQITEKALKPIEIINRKKDFNIKIRVKGGGFNGQAEAIKLALAKALLKISEEYKPILKSFSFLTQDKRKVERNKVGNKKARKKPQYSKR